MTRPLIVVDAANVVGSRPDGWWRDRHGATERLRDRLAALADQGLPDLNGPVEVVMIVEGRARGVTSSPTVTTVPAAGSGDDRIVETVAEHPGRRRVVVTADRELRQRVGALGAEVIGPSALESFTATGDV
ncbi:hypothetical protein AAFP35_10820 [Gordonia sp. CPCC 206044]|uniref:hypothetical protein n=1 Tax=Gordonia sp. CPCC 206044 TaxID=3140793 RepID=UPI003AF33C91